MKKEAQSTVCFDREKILIAVRNVTALHVSLAKFGSYSAELTPAVRAKLFEKFCRDFDLFKKLGEARQVLSEPFESDLAPGEEEDELGRELKDVQFWRPPSDG